VQLQLDRSVASYNLYLICSFFGQIEDGEFLGKDLVKAQSNCIV
jgi:hypothetical protein